MSTEHTPGPRRGSIWAFPGGLTVRVKETGVAEYQTANMIGPAQVSREDAAKIIRAYRKAIAGITRNGSAAINKAKGE